MRIFKWRYKNIELILRPSLRINGKETVWKIGGDFRHLLCEMAALAHLIEVGFDKDGVLFQQTMNIAGKKFRPDIFVPSKNLWIECLGCELEKLRYLHKNFRGRIVWIRDHKDFLFDWRADFIDKFDIGLPKEKRKELKKQHREENFPLGIEVWAMLLGKNTARILYAVRRDDDDAYTFYNSAEGWALSGLGYIRKRKDRVEGLII